MKLFPIILFLSAIALFADRFPPGPLVSSKAPAAGGGGETCDTIAETFNAGLNELLSTGDKYMAVAITNSSTEVCAVGLLIAVHASQTNTYSVSLCSNNATNRPNGVLGTSDTVTSAAIGTTTNWVKFTFASPVTLSAGSSVTNWIRLQKHVDPVDGFATTWTRGNGNVEICVRSQNGDDWTNLETTRQGLYRLYTSP